MKIASYKGNLMDQLSIFNNYLIADYKKIVYYLHNLYSKNIIRNLLSEKKNT